MEETKNWCEELLKEVENQIEEINKQSVNNDNLAYLGKLVDIHEDLKNEKYWKENIETMRYRARNNYGDNYNNGYGDNYRESYGRRGYDARYRGEGMIDNMYQAYQGYSDGREYGRGSYGHNEETTKNLEYMMGSVVDFVNMLKQDAGSQEEMEIIKKYTKQISEM